MWDENTDTSNIFQTVWPRMGAIAERLWSPRSMVNLTTAKPRMLEFRCLLNERGIAAAPVSNVMSYVICQCPGRGNPYIKPKPLAVMTDANIRAEEAGTSRAAF